MTRGQNDERVDDDDVNDETETIIRRTHDT